MVFCVNSLCVTALCNSVILFVTRLSIMHVILVFERFGKYQYISPATTAAILIFSWRVLDSLQIYSIDLN